MSENDDTKRPVSREAGTSTKGTAGKAQDQDGQNAAQEVQEAPRTVGRQQLGEKVTGTVTTRVPRGVGEPPADALSDDPGIRLTQESVRDQVNADIEKGFRGTQADPTPNENYTVAGVTAGAPTPETVVYTPRGE